MIKILAIEDDNTDFLAITRAVKGLGETQITQATTGKDAIELVKKEKFNCIILDYYLPDTDGLELLEKLDKMNLKTPIIFSTAKGEEIVATKAIDMGAQNYFPKNKIAKEQSLFLKCIVNALDMDLFNEIEEKLKKYKDL
jgi:CheY-like chemotaxis protein